MRQQDKLKNTLREYYDNQQTPYNSEEWERASAYLQTERNKRKVTRAVIIITSLLLILGLILFNFHKSENNENQTLASNQRPAVVIKQEATHGVTSSVKQDHDKVSGNPAPTVISTPKPAMSVQKKQFDVLYHDVLPGTESKTPETRLDHIDQTNTTNTAIKPDNDPVAELTPVVINSNKPHDDEKNIGENEFADQKEISKTDLITAKDPVQNQPAVTDPKTSETLPDTPGTIALNDNKNVTGIKKSDERPGVLASTNPDTARVIDSPVPVTAAEIVISDTLPKSVYDDRPGEGIFYEAGAAWFYGWKGSEHYDARGFSPVAGVSYMNQLSKRCAFSFGFRYLNVPNLSNSSKTSRVSSYVYGEESRVTVITPSTVHYVQLPLRFHYFKDPANSFGIGINLAYLLNVDATVTSYDEKPGFTGNYKTTKLGGYTEGFSWFDSQLAFCYTRRINRSFGLQAEIFAGLTDVKQDDFFGFSGKERNSGAKVSLIYYAFRKNIK